MLLDADGAVVGEGHHRGAGGPARRDRRPVARRCRARGGTAVVTLEPCNHTGRTGPCADALIDAGVARVVYAVDDPNPLAAGGAGTLRAAGVEVEGGLLAEAASLLNPVWTFAVRRGRPFVTGSAASTLDGRIAAADGTSRWITSAEARADVHELRAGVDAIVVGTGTVLADDPHLDRTPRGRRLPPAAAAARRRRPPRPALGRARPRRRGPDRSTCAPHDPPRSSPTSHAREVRHGPARGRSDPGRRVPRAGLVDEVRWYLAPTLLGAGANALGDAGIATIAEAFASR